MCPRCEWRWWNKDLFEYEQRLLAAGWLPPYEGRRVYEGTMTAFGVKEALNMEVAPGWYRIILEPFPKKEAEE
jgi:hypothetical protein